MKGDTDKNYCYVYGLYCDILVQYFQEFKYKGIKIWTIYMTKEKEIGNGSYT